MYATDTGSSVQVRLGDGRYVEVGYEKHPELDAAVFTVPTEALADLIALMNSYGQGR